MRNKIEGTPILKLAMVKDKKIVKKIEIDLKNSWEKFVEKFVGKICWKNSSEKFIEKKFKFFKN